MLSMLNLPPSAVQRGPAINSLILAPHRDFAYQLLHWIKCMYAGASHSGDVSPFAQVMVRSADSPIPEQVQRIREQPPRILIGTPQAVLEALTAQGTSLSLQYLSAVVVEEADYLLEYWVAAQKRKYELEKFQRQLRSHPSPTRQILNFLYPPVDAYWERPGKRRTPRPKLLENTTALPPDRRPQLIMTSATLKSAFRNSVMSGGLWYASAPRKPLIITSATTESDGATVGSVYGGTKLVHSALIVSDDGSILNFPGAINPTSDAEHDGQEEPSTADEEPEERIVPTQPSLPTTEGLEAGKGLNEIVLRWSTDQEL